MDLKNDKKCIIYCRVSSKEQEDRGYSLEAQEKLLTEYADKNKLNVVKIFKISESASGKQIRKTFNEMLVFVKKKKINIILCEKIDRLTRNLKDGAVISDWVMADENRQVHFVKENFVVSRNTRAHENLVWDMKVAIARFYTNNLSEEVKKGQKAKIESGWIPTQPKLGYKTIGEKGHKIHVIDKDKAKFIKQMFELYNSGNYTLNKLVEKLEEDGFRHKTGKPLGKSSMHRILSEPFYSGRILWNGKEYDGKHEPIISEEVFDEVQLKLKRHTKGWQYKIHNHIFKGLIRCGACGCLITWETQKNHHYGRCKGYRGCLQKGCIREEAIEDGLFDSLEKIKPMNTQVLNWIKKALKEAHKDKKDYSHVTREGLNKQLEKIEKRIDKIYDDKIDEVISREYYDKRFKEYSMERKSILKQLDKHGNKLDNYYETGIDIHDLAFNAKRLYLSRKATPDDKRIIMNKIFISMHLESKDLYLEYKPAYQFLSEWMPKLNATSELLKESEHYKKTGAFAPANPLLLGGRESNPDLLDQNQLSYR